MKDKQKHRVTMPTEPVDIEAETRAVMVRLGEAARLCPVAFGQGLKEKFGCGSLGLGDYAVVCHTILAQPDPRFKVLLECLLRAIETLSSTNKIINKENRRLIAQYGIEVAKGGRRDDSKGVKPHLVFRCLYCPAYFMEWKDLHIHFLKEHKSDDEI